MKRYAQSAAGCLLCLLALGLAWRWPGPALALSVVGFVTGLKGIFKANTPLSRGLGSISALSLGLVILFGSGSALLGATGGLLAASHYPSEFLFRRFGHGGAFPLPFGMLLAVAVMTSPFVSGIWILSLLPLIAFGVLWMMGGMKDVQNMNQAAMGGWRVEIGRPVPDVLLTSRDGQSEFQLSKERGRFILLCFLRGDWCPACHMMMRIYKKEAENLAQHGVKNVAISPSSGPEAEDFAKMIGVDYVLLSDPDCKAAQMFGAILPGAFQGKDVPLPASFLVDPEGVLRFASVPQNVQAFLDPKLVVGILEQRTLKAA